MYDTIIISIKEEGIRMANVKNLATQMGWEIEDKTAYGVYQGFELSLFQNVDFNNAKNNGKILFVAIQLPSIGVIQLLDQDLLANKKELRINSVIVSPDFVQVQFKEVMKTLSFEQFEQFLQQFIVILQHHNATPKQTCVYCGLDDCDTTTYLNRVRFRAHAACVETVKQKNTEIYTQKMSEATNGIGYVGALLGAIIGAVPYAIAVWFGWYIGLLTFLTGFISYEGFKLMGGVAKKPTKYVIGAITFGIVLLSNVALMGVVALDNNVTIADVLAVEDIRAIFYESLSMSAIFGILGILLVFGRIKRDEHQSVIK